MHGAQQRPALVAAALAHGAVFGASRATVPDVIISSFCTAVALVRAQIIMNTFTSSLIKYNSENGQRWVSAVHANDERQVMCLALQRFISSAAAC